jgi:hypothetical protein
MAGEEANRLLPINFSFLSCCVLKFCIIQAQRDESPMKKKKRKKGFVIVSTNLCSDFQDLLELLCCINEVVIQAVDNGVRVRVTLLVLMPLRLRQGLERGDFGLDRLDILLNNGSKLFNFLCWVIEERSGLGDYWLTDNEVSTDFTWWVSKADMLELAPAT